jgi:FkbM family methyltransferase
MIADLRPLHSSHLKHTVRRILPRRFRNWLRSPSKSAEWLWKEIKYVVGSRDTVEMRPGWSLTCHPLAYRFAYFAQHSDPEQAAELDTFISSCRHEMVLFDIGAHFGLFSLAALHFGGEQATAVAIEPSPVATRILKIQASLNDVSDRLRIIEACAADHNGPEAMLAVGVLASGYLVPSSKNHSADELISANAITIESIVEQLQQCPTHVKIDVEGGEFAVLQGAKRLLSRSIPPLLFIELHNELVRERDGDPERTLDLLENHGYKTFACDGSQMSKHSILSRPLVRVVAKNIC